MTLPDDDVRPRPGGLIREQDQPQDLDELERGRRLPGEVADGEREAHDEAGRTPRPTR